MPRTGTSRPGPAVSLVRYPLPVLLTVEILDFTAVLSLYSRFIRKILVRYALTVGSVHQPCRGFVSFRWVQISSNKSSAQLAALSTFKSVQVKCPKPFSRQSIRFKSSVQVAVLSTVGSIQVECPSRCSLDNRFNSGQVSKSPFSRQSRIRQLYRRRFNTVRVGCPLAVLPTSGSSAAVSSLCTLGFLKTIKVERSILAP